MKPLVELAVPLPDVLEEVDGEYRLKGHRITLYHVISAYRNGIVPHAMVFYYPTLSLAEIERVFAFYEANRATVDEFLEKYNAVLNEQRRAGKTLDRAELLRRFQVMREANVSERNSNGRHYANGPAAAPLP
jgi:uncharacterized protein (DUF433 family)